MSGIPSAIGIAASCWWRCRCEWRLAGVEELCGGGGGGAASVHEKEDHQRQPQSSCVASSMKTQKNLPKTVHPQLRVHLSRALARMCNTFLVDRRVLDECLCEISEALLKADFPTEMVSELRLKVKKAMDPTVSGCNQSIHQVLCKEICKLIDSGRKPSFVPKKGKPCIVLVIGLQGSGNTTSCAKFGYHHRHKGYKPSLVCTDTRGSSSLDHTKQIAREAKIPFYGSNLEPDPVRVAVQGVEKFKKENSDLIIIDTSGSSTSEDAFFDEIHKIEKATKPDLVVLVVDAGAGKSAFDLAVSFKRNGSIGSAIVSKMDRHPNGGGTLSALAAAKCPVIFYGTGKQVDAFETFDVKVFSNNLLDYKNRTFTIDVEDMHGILGNLQVSDIERTNAVLEMEKTCLNAYHAVLKEHRMLIQQISCSESEYNKICDILGEQELKKSKIKSASSLKERKELMMISLKTMKQEKDERTRKFKDLISKALDLWNFLGVTCPEQRAYKSRLNNLSSFLQEANSLSAKSLEKLEKMVKELECKKVKQLEAMKAKQDILRRAEIFIRRTEGSTNFASLKDLISTAVTWEAQQRDVILYEQESLVARLKMVENDMRIFDSASTAAREEDKGDTHMGTSSSSSETTKSDPKDRDYMPESSESDVDMRDFVVSESSGSVSS